MPYGGPVYSPRVQDKSADYIFQGAADLWGGIGKGLSAGIGKAVDERQKSKALQARFDMLADQGYATPELRDKFYTGSTSAQAGIMAELMARMDRDAADAKERESKRRFDLGYGLDEQRLNQQADQFGQRMGFDRMQATQDADYRNATLEQNQQEQEAKRRPVEWSPLPGTDYIANDRGSVVPVRRQEEPGFIGDDSGLGYYQDAQGNPVNPANILMQPPQPERNFFDFLPQKRQTAVPGSAGAPEGTLFPGDGTGGGMDLPSNPGRPMGPSSLLQPLIPRAAAPKAPPRVQTATLSDAEGNEQLVQVLPDGTWRPMQPAQNPPTLGAPAAAAPAKPKSKLEEWAEKHLKK